MSDEQNKFVNKASLAQLIGLIKKADNTALASAKTYADGLNTAMDARAAKLEATHAVDGDAFKTVAAEIAAVTGTPDSGKTLQAEIDAAESAIDKLNGTTDSTSVSKKIADAINALDTATGGVTSTGGARVSVNLVEANGIVTGLTVSENDIAQASVVGAIPSGATATTVVGYAKEVADAAQKEADDRLTTAEAAITKLNGADTVDGSVAKSIKGAVEALDADIKSSDVEANKGANVNVEVVEDNGKITAVKVTESDIASAAALGKLQTAVGVSELASGAKNLVTRIAANEEAIGTKKTDSAAATGLYLYVDDAAAAAVAQVVASADSDFDTLKEVADWIKSDSTGAAKMQSQLSTLTGTGDGSVSKALSDAKSYADGKINALDKDLTGTNAVKSTDGHVTVGIKEEDGVITSLTVATDDIASASALSTLTTYVGTAKNGDTAATGLTAQVEALEAAVGAGGSVGTQIDAKINALDVDTYKDGVASTSGHVTVGIQETDGKISAFTVADNDIASAALLGTTSDASTAATAFGYIAKEAADRAAAIAALDADITSDDDAPVTVEVKETDGKIVDVVVTAQAYTADEITTLWNGTNAAN